MTPQPIERQVATLTATVDQLQAEVDRRDDTLLDLVAILVLAAISMVAADVLIRRRAL